MSQKVAIVTGGAQSIGAGIAEVLVEHGTRVMIADLDAEAGASTTKRLGTSAAFVRCDVSVSSDIDDLIAATMKRWGRIDVLVNNAVLPLDGGIAATSDEWLRSYAVNVVGPAMLIRAALLHLEKHRGVVVNIASISGYRAQEGRWVYAASKAALLQLTRSAARDLGPRGVRVVSVSPGWTQSRAIGGLGAGGEARADRIAGPFSPLGRAGRPRDIGEAVAWLASDAAGFVTGVDLAVDGGYLVLGPER